jgi:hypothetical protein
MSSSSPSGAGSFRLSCRKNLVHISCKNNPLILRIQKSIIEEWTALSFNISMFSTSGKASLPRLTPQYSMRNETPVLLGFTYGILVATLIIFGMLIKFDFPISLYTSERTAVFSTIPSKSLTPSQDLLNSCLEPINPECLRSPLFCTSGDSKYVEDRSYVRWLPACDQAKTSTFASAFTASRVILVDWGANTFDSSIGYFIQHYPLEFTDIFAVEVNPNIFKIPPPQIYSPIHYFNAFIDTADVLTSSPPHLNATRFLLDIVHVRPEDWLLVKVDVEGSEYDLLKSLQRDNVLYLIDEIAVEFHYCDDPRLYPFGWAIFKSHKQQDAVDWLHHLRSLNIAAHYWP